MASLLAVERSHSADAFPGTAAAALTTDDNGGYTVHAGSAMKLLCQQQYCYTDWLMCACTPANQSSALAGEPRGWSVSTASGSATRRRRGATRLPFPAVAPERQIARRRERVRHPQQLTLVALFLRRLELVRDRREVHGPEEEDDVDVEDS